MPQKHKYVDIPDGRETMVLEGVARLEAIGRQIYSGPDTGKGAWPGRFAKHLGITDRRLRQVRQSGKVPEKLMARAMAEWQLWRRRLSDSKTEARRRSRRVKAKARLQAIQERGLAALGEVGE